MEFGWFFKSKTTIVQFILNSRRVFEINKMSLFKILIWSNFLRNNGPFRRYGGQFELYCFKLLLRDAQGQISMYLPPQHPIIAIRNNTIQNGRRIAEMVHFLTRCNSELPEVTTRISGNVLRFEDLIVIRPFPSCLLPLFQNEALCETNHIKLSSAYRFIFMRIKLAFIWKSLHEDSLSFEIEAQSYSEMTY